MQFAAVKPGPNAHSRFSDLLDACESFASTKSLLLLRAGMNTSRHEAYRGMLAKGFRTEIRGIVMQWRNEPGYNVPDAYIIDDWR